MKHNWGRSQKYHVRPRELYALLFDNGCAYIGQSVDVSKREQQHRRPSGGWGGKSFSFVVLCEIECTEEQAKDYEHAWRHKAAKNGWSIYGKPPAMIVNHHKQMTLKRYWLAWGLRWPAQRYRNRAGRALAWGFLAIGLLLFYHATSW